MFWYWIYWQTSCHMEYTWMMGEPLSTLWDMIPTNIFMECVDAELEDEDYSD